MMKLQQYIAFIIGFISTLGSCSNNDTVSSAKERDSEYKRILVMHFPQPVRSPEPYTYPGPSPPINIPPRSPDPYPIYIPPSSYYGKPSDFQGPPKWCKAIWEREDCGMKCWMLRKICRNIIKQTLTKDDNVESSSSISYPSFKPLYPYYLPKKQQNSIIYGKPTLSSNAYYIQSTWPSSYYKRPYYHKYTTPEFGLNPQFTYLDGNEQLGVRTTTSPTIDNEHITEGTTTTTTVKPTGETTTSKVKVNPSRKGVYSVRVKQSEPPPDSEVQTLSPLMFDYDQYSTRGYYGDRVYMSAVMPVTDRELRSNDYDEYDDFDEMIIEP